MIRSLLLLILCLATAVAAGQPAVASAAGQRIWLDAPRNLNLRYVGRSGAAALGNGHAQALSLAQGDLDEDGVADLVVGYATANGGAVAIHRGNPDARAPQSHKSFLAVGRGQFPDPFLPDVDVLDVGVMPDLLAVADLDGDGHKDIIIGSRTSATVYALLGDGKDKFPRTLQFNLPGKATALAAQRMDRASASSTLLVGITGVDGAPPALLVLSTTPAGIRPLFSLPLPGPLVSFAFGDLDHDAYPDAALVAGGQLFILHGADVHAVSARTGSAHLEAVSVGVSAVSVDVGTFINDRDPRQQLAVMGSDGSVRIVTHAGLDTRPWSAAELATLHQASLRGHPRILAADPDEGWTVAESFPGVTAGSKQALMMRSRISGNGLDDILVADPGSGQLHQISHASVRHPQQLVNGFLRLAGDGYLHDSDNLLGFRQHRNPDRRWHLRSGGKRGGQQRLFGGSQCLRLLPGVAGHSDHHLPRDSNPDVWNPGYVVRDGEFGIGGELCLDHADNLQRLRHDGDSAVEWHLQHQGDAGRQRGLYSSRAGYAEFHGQSRSSENHASDDSGDHAGNGNGNRGCYGFLGIAGDGYLHDSDNLLGFRQHRNPDYRWHLRSGGKRGGQQRLFGRSQRLRLLLNHALTTLTSVAQGNLGNQIMAVPRHQAQVASGRRPLPGRTCFRTASSGSVFAPARGPVVFSLAIQSLLCCCHVALIPLPGIHRWFLNGSGKRKR
jgi:hypothetical protein